jgi:hypothetical protein
MSSSAEVDRPWNEEELAVVLKAYELERTDDIHSGYAFLTMLTVSIGLISLIGFALINVDDEDLPGWMFLLVPFLPLPFAGLAALYVHLAQVRGAILDLYEGELRRRFPELSAGVLRVPSGHTVLGRLWVGAYGRAVLALVAAPLIAMYFAVIVESYRIAHRTEPTWANIVLGIGVIAGLVLAHLLLIAQDPRKVVAREAARLRDGRLSGDAFPPL